MTYGAKAYYIHWTTPILHRERERLQSTGSEIYLDDQDFKKFANWLRDQIPAELLAKERTRLQADANDEAFTCNLLPKLDLEAKMGILRFALSDRVTSIARHYLGFVPRLAGAWVQFNIPKSRGPKGSQNWHRDGDIHKGVNFFICLSDVDSESGALSVIGKNWIAETAEISGGEPDMTKSVWDRYRQTDEDMFRFVSTNAVQTLSGPPGTTAVVDPAWCYHKGGHCSSRDRLLIQISFYTEEQTSSARMKNILSTLGIQNHPQLSAIVDSPLRRYMVGGFHEPFVDGGIFTTLSHKLTYHLKQPLA